MKLEVKKSTLITLFTLIGILFFTGVVGFLFRTSGGGEVDRVLADAEGSPVKKIVGLFLLLVCLFYAVRYKLIFNTKFLMENFWIFTFVFYIFLTCLWSVEVATSFRRVILLISLMSFAAYLTRFYSIDVLYKMIGYIIALTAFIGLCKAVISPSEAFVSGGIREGAFTGMYVEKNGGARAYVLGITLLLPAVSSGNKNAWFAASLCLLCLFMARSASGILLLLIGAGSFIYFNRLIISNKYLVNKASYVGGIFAYFVGLFIAYSAYELLLSLVGRDPTLTNRTVIWDLLAPLINDKINQGYGYGAFWASPSVDEFLSLWGYIGNAHNGYLEILLHGGIPMLIIFVFMTLKSFSNAINNACKVKNYKEYNISLCIIIQLLISNFIAYSLPNHNSTDFFIFMLVVFYANQKQCENHNDSK